jgi:superfamily I DNA/RNA helicase
MWDVFIAYSSSDRAIASRLADALEKRLHVFIDFRCIRPGDDWDTALRDALEETTMVVVLVSPSTEQSFFQRDEILRALERSRTDPSHTRLIPIFIGGTGPTQPSMPYGLRPKQGIVLANEDELGNAAERIIDLATEGESRQLSPSLRAFFAGLHQDVQQLTQDQYRVIQYLRYVRRVRISGCAGSGKTLVGAE